ncbi:MAG: hypothetical protein RLZZ584_2888 [Pseudomonadota bacterium]
MSAMTFGFVRGLLLLLMLAAQHIGATAAGKESFPIAEYLCAITPSDCHSELYRRVYLAPPDATYEIVMNGRRLVVPMGYIDTAQLMSDPRYPVKTSIFMEALMPGLAPHSPTNLREFFVPYALNKVTIRVGTRLPGAMTWLQAHEWTVTRIKKWSNTLVARPSKYGLNGWGEDFVKWPRRRPCSNLREDEPPCKAAAPDDIWTPVVPNGPPSSITCTPEILVDHTDKIVTLTKAEQEAYFSDRTQWMGRRRAMCIHDMLIESINSTASVEYPRRFLGQWRETENAIRNMFDDFIRAGLVK